MIAVRFLVVLLFFHEVLDQTGSLCYESADVIGADHLNGCGTGGQFPLVSSFRASFDPAAAEDYGERVGHSVRWGEGLGKPGSGLFLNVFEFLFPFLLCGCLLRCRWGFVIQR